MFIGTKDWFKIGKGGHQSCILSPCLLNLYAEYIMWNAGLDASHTGFAQDWQEKYQQPQICRWHHLTAESEEELKSLLMKVKEESEKAGLKFKIQKAKIMASSPTTSWQIDGGNVETVSDFIFLGSRINADSKCSHKIKRHSLLERIAMSNLDSILKSRDITLLTKVCVVKPMVFPVVVYGSEVGP